MPACSDAVTLTSNDNMAMSEMKWSDAFEGTQVGSKAPDGCEHPMSHE
jgi:hypothetical protein